MPKKLPSFNMLKIHEAKNSFFDKNNMVIRAFLKSYLIIKMEKLWSI